MLEYLFHSPKRMAVLTCLLYFICIGVNFAPMASKVVITRGEDITRHPWWISFALSLLLLVMVIYTEFLTRKKLQYVIISFIISILFAIFFILEWFFIANNNDPALASFLSVGYFLIYFLYGPFYGISCLFDAGTFTAGNTSVQYVYIMPYINLITFVMIVNAAYVFVLLMKNRASAIKIRRKIK